MDFSKTVFVTDFDGTLLTADKRITDADLQAIYDYRAEGGLFGIATGRPIQTVRKYLEYLPVDLPLILYNGCIVYDHRKDKILYSSYLPEVAKEIFVDVRERFPGVSPEVYTFGSQNYFVMNHVEKWHHQILGMEFDKLESHTQITEPWCKMLLADEVEVIDELSDYIKKYQGRGVRFVRSLPTFLEVLPEDASKGTALTEVVKMCYLGDKFVCTAGDYDNDIEMLRAADLSFCPSNSQQCVKDVSDFVLTKTCDEGAIAEALAILKSWKKA